MNKKKPLFAVDKNKEIALQMLDGEPEEKKQLEDVGQQEETSNLTEEVKENEVNKGAEVEEISEKSEEKPMEKKKSNAGRKRIYEEGELIKLTALIDKHLSTTLKTVTKKNGTKIQHVLIPYIEEWIKDDHGLKNPYATSETKKYTGINVPVDLRHEFAKVCVERKKSQGFVLEALYQKAIEDLS